MPLVYGFAGLVGAVATVVMFWEYGALVAFIGAPIGGSLVALMVAVIRSALCR
jgi:hypothetical protein